MFLTDRRPQPSATQRLIIAIDLDAFYLSVERLLDPSLRGVPVGVVQKSLLATTSYEARALGVGKLISIKRGLEICPTLKLVNGEDLTKYRAYSKRVRDLVNGLLLPEHGVEKLGLDEVFLDVTELVDRHLLAQIRPSDVAAVYQPRPTSRQVRDDGGCFFSLPMVGSTARGFWYRPDAFHSHVLPDDVDRNHHATARTRLQAASHLCAYVRGQIFEQLGLTTSAGVGRSKQIAKLVGTANKPNDQTTFLDYLPDAVQDFLDPMDIRRLNGFGGKICAVVAEAMVKAGYEDAMAATEGDIANRRETSSTTVKMVRTVLDASTFLRLFGQRLGERLWGLLHGVDDDPVTPTPPFPKQISVEDSYAMVARRNLRTISQQMEGLVVDLLFRLEDELLDHVSQGGRAWLRYPTRLSLALRRGWDVPGGRDSKSIHFPSFFFDIKTTREERAARFQRAAGDGLLRDLLGVSRSVRDVPNTTVFEVFVINVSATNLSTVAPPPSLQDAWLNAAERPQRHLEIDMDVLNALPDDLRREMIRQYGLSEADVVPEAGPSRLHDTPTSLSPTKPVPVQEVGARLEDLSDEDGDDDIMNDPLSDGSQPSAESDGSDDGLDADDDRPTCSVCGEQVYNFALTAHRRWHEEQDGVG